MQRIIIGAAVLLICQLGLVAALNINRGGYETFTPDTPFLQLKAEDLTALEITDGEGHQLELRKDAGGWVVPSLFGAPVNQAQLTALLTKLADLKQGLAVATSAGSAKRFKVAEDDFERHVTLKAADRVLGDFYVGTSPGIRQAHVRKSGHDEIAAVMLSTFELPTDGDKWLDRELLKLDEEEIVGLTFAGFSLTKKDEGWQLEGLGEGQKTSQDEVKRLLGKVAGLTIQSVMEPRQAAGLLAKEPNFTFSVILKDQSQRDYGLAEVEAGGLWVLKTSDHDHYYTVSKVQLDFLKQTTRDTLIGGEEAVPPNAGPDQGPAAIPAASAGQAQPPAPPAQAGAPPADGQHGAP